MHMEYYAVVKTSDLSWMWLEDIMLSEISHKEKDKYQTVSLLSGIWYMEGEKEEGKEKGR